MEACVVVGFVLFVLLFVSTVLRRIGKNKALAHHTSTFHCSSVFVVVYYSALFFLSCAVSLVRLRSFTLF